MDRYGWNSTFYAENEPTHLPKARTPVIDDIVGGCEICGEPIYSDEKRITFRGRKHWITCHSDCAKDEWEWLLKELDIKEEG